mmetsp:Transcript_15401/g.26105  ORF Transcript_15401/g.26105 Transcript_15401/m.26105 type:complete len:97 (+) Transcript_15401:68-358(+)
MLLSIVAFTETDGGGGGGGIFIRLEPMGKRVVGCQEEEAAHTRQKNRIIISLSRSPYMFLRRLSNRSLGCLMGQDGPLTPSIPKWLDCTIDWTAAV